MPTFKHSKRKLGQSNYEVNPIGLGGMPLSIDGRPDQQTAIKVIQTAVDLGVDFIDTANVYCLNDEEIGHNETLIQTALAQMDATEKVIVATKGGLRRPNGDWVVDGRPEFIIESCEQSLRALNTDCIKLYQLHAPDPKVPFLSTLEALAKLQANGKIELIGLSNVTVAQIDEAETLVDVASVQNRCNPHDLRAFDDGVFQTCRERKITFLPYSPVGGRHHKQNVAEDVNLTEIARVHQADNFQVTLAWLMQLGAHCLPIPGASKISSIQSSIDSMDLMLSDDQIAVLNEAFGLKL